MYIKTLVDRYNLTLVSIPRGGNGSRIVLSQGQISKGETWVGSVGEVSVPAELPAITLMNNILLRKDTSSIPFFNVKIEIKR